MALTEAERAALWRRGDLTDAEQAAFMDALMQVAERRLAQPRVEAEVYAGRALVYEADLRAEAAVALHRAADRHLHRARPTFYNGVLMRSRLEARFAGWLDEMGAPWTYEPSAFASKAGQYLPDFLVGERAYLEVRPWTDGFDPLPVLKRMAVILSSDAGAHLAVVTPKPGSDWRAGLWTAWCADVDVVWPFRAEVFLALGRLRRGD